MADDAGAQAQPAISALPSATVRQLGSHQLLTDPSSVVKELIDNALDARAKSIFIDIAANTIDSMQVKDDGHGIPHEDRALACLRSCTSKIRDFHDLKRVGGKWLGFRGEALASIADMSGTVSITTRVEGESVAVKLAYNRNGELISTERVSHPVGTTVKITKLLESAKVRKELAMKSSSRCPAKIRRITQAYALARPAVRFRLNVSKAKNKNGDFSYAPKAGANVENAAFKVVGKDCAFQCDWTALELNGFDVHAFLPKPGTIASKIANYGAFVSVDSRPVSVARGTLKKIAAAVRMNLRSKNSTLSNIKDPFFYMYIICPTDSYDPNIEPAKDDVIFSDESSVVALVDQLLTTYYSEESTSVIHTDPLIDRPELPQPSGLPDLEEMSPQSRSPVLPAVDEYNMMQQPTVRVSELRTQQSCWRSSMYGIDEEDVDSLQPSTPFTIREKEGCRDAAISNPWTIARMNAPIRSRKNVSNGQLLSPEKNQGDASPLHLTPTSVAAPDHSGPFEPLTPQSTPDFDLQQNRLDDELQRSIQRWTQEHPPNVTISSEKSRPSIFHTPAPTSFDVTMAAVSARSAPLPPVPDDPLPGRKRLQNNERSHPPSKNRSVVPPVPQSHDTWFGQPMRHLPKNPRSQKRSQKKMPTFSPKDNTYSSHRSLVLPAAERLVEARLASENDSDIRDFFGKLSRDKVHGLLRAGTGDVESSNIADQLRAHDKHEVLPRRPQSADSHQHSVATTQEMDRVFQLHQNVSSGPLRGIKPSSIASPARHTPSLQRCRTTDSCFHRTKSSTLPLNYIPQGSETQNLSLTFNTNVSAISHHARKLNMTANSVERGYDSTDAFDVFGSPVPERKVIEWVVKVDALLCTIFERVDGVEIQGALQEGIRRFLDARREQEEEDSKRAVANTNMHVSDSAGPHDSTQVIHGKLPCVSPCNLSSGSGQVGDGRTSAVANWMAKTEAEGTPAKSDTDENDLNLSKDVDAEDDARQGSPAQKLKVEDEFGDGIDDVMLMDL